MAENTHRYVSDPPGSSREVCSFGCGCWQEKFRSGGPEGVDPRGVCPNAPLPHPPEPKPIFDSVGRGAIRRFVREVDRRALETMEEQGKIEGAHNAAIRTVARDWGIPLDGPEDGRLTDRRVIVVAGGTRRVPRAATVRAEPAREVVPPVVFDRPRPCRLREDETFKNFTLAAGTALVATGKFSNGSLWVRVVEPVEREGHRFSISADGVEWPAGEAAP